jgi:repressor LexA
MMIRVPRHVDCAHTPQRGTSQTTADSVQCHDSSSTLGETNSVGPASLAKVSYQLSSVQSYRYLRHDATRPCAAEARLLAHSVVRLESQDLIDTHGIPSRDAAYVSAPVMGQIRAGDLHPAERVPDGTFLLPKQIVGEGPLFMLRVVGDSMMNAAIADGSWVVVRQQPKAENGEIVAAMIDGEATVKILQHRDGHVWLMPRNPDYAPILGDEATILGRVVAVVSQV